MATKYQVQMHGKGNGAEPRSLADVTIMTHSITAAEGLPRKAWLNVSGIIGQVEDIALYDVTLKGILSDCIGSATFSPEYETVKTSRIKDSVNTVTEYTIVKSLKIFVKIGQGKAYQIRPPKHDKDSGRHETATSAAKIGDTIWPPTRNGQVSSDERLWIETAMREIFTKAKPSYVFQTPSSTRAVALSAAQAAQAAAETAAANSKAEAEALRLEMAEMKVMLAALQAAQAAAAK